VADQELLAIGIEAAVVEVGGGEPGIPDLQSKWSVIEAFPGQQHLVGVQHPVSPLLRAT
jgi:hypothetical protein